MGNIDMRGQISMRKISELLRQRHELKCGYRSIAKSLNISISTVSDYLSRAKVAGLSWPLPEGMSENCLYEKLFLPVNKEVIKRPKPDWEWVHKELRQKGVTLLLLWREYKECHPEGIGYTRFCVNYRSYSKSIAPVMRQIHKAGEKCFVDYAGMTLPWVDTTNGIIHEAQIFVGALGASQFTFVEATATQQLPDWTQSHVHMFEAFQGVPNIVVPDNLKSGVHRSHRYDPDINQNYQALGEHYGFAIVPARAFKPTDKAKVENAVGCIEMQILAPLRHQTFTNLPSINAAIKARLAVFLNQPFQKMKVSRQELYEAIDKPALKPLPLEPYQYAEWKKAKIHIDYHFVFDDHYYSVPYRYIHKPTEIRGTSKTVECFHQGIRIAAHARSFKRYGYTTLNEHMPEAHRAQAEWTPERIQRWAQKIGSETAAFINSMIASRPFPEQAYRACLGTLRLGNKYTELRLEKACAKGLAVGATRYQQIESILKKGLEEVPLLAESESTAISDHSNIRGPNYYQQPGDVTC
jgi:transposase